MKKVHFIGIGGAGISALASMAKQMGYDVSGSNMSSSLTTTKMEAKGIKVNIGHSADAVTSDIDFVIRTSAATHDTPAGVEIKQAESLGIPVYSREYLIAEFASRYYSIGVAGTHGKTTTSGLIAHILIKMNLDPTYLVGGIVSTTGENAGVGAGEYFVWEADEFANAYHGVKLNTAILNNIDYDHPDYFKSEEEYLASFYSFTHQNVSDLLVVNADNEKAMHAAVGTSAKVKTFGHCTACDYCIQDLNPEQKSFRINFTDASVVVHPLLLGKHNVQNITGAFALLHELGLDANELVQAIESYSGTERRFETLFQNNFVQVISDYAHHPTAVKVTVEAAKSLGNKTIAVFEPHQFIRVKTLLPDYKGIFDAADEVWVLPIYASRDLDTNITNSQELLSVIDHKHKKLISPSELLSEIKSEHSEKTTYLCMSAGNLDDFLRKELLKKH